MSVALITAEELEAAIARALDPLRQQIEQLRRERTTGGLVTMKEAAARLGVTVRAVQKWAKSGQLEVVQVGGVRMVRLP